MGVIPLAEITELLQVVLVNLVLSADNAIVVGIAVAGLPAHNRTRVMAIGMSVATTARRARMDRAKVASVAPFPAPAG